MNEKWLPIAGWEGLYEVSDMGNVRSLPKEVVANGRRMKFPGKILVGGISRGYLLVNFRDSGRYQCFYVHLLVLKTFVGERPEGYEACHGNGIRTDNRLNNLRWDTKEENTKDRFRHGMTMPGEQNPNSILTEAAVIEIRKATTKAELIDLADRFGVTVRCIKSVRWGESWKHVKSPAWAVENGVRISCAVEE